MKSQMSKHWGGKGYNSPIKQVNMHTKLKDVPGELMNSGKKILNSVVDTAVDYGRKVGNKISNASVGEALNVTGVAYGVPPGTLVPKEKKFLIEKKLMKTSERLSKKK